MPQIIKNNEWKTNKEKALKRDKHRCFHCGDTFRISVHHINGKGLKYPTEKQNNKLNNLITLCSYCHLYVHKKLRAEKKFIEQLKKESKQKRENEKKSKIQNIKDKKYLVKYYTRKNFSRITGVEVRINNNKIIDIIETKKEFLNDLKRAKVYFNRNTNIIDICLKEKVKTYNFKTSIK